MKKAEFDKFAEEYKSLHTQNIKLSGEKPDFFAEYKVLDTVDLIKKCKLNSDVINILDFGAGIGNSIPFFRKYFINAELTCLDVSEKSLQIAKERFPDQAEFVEFDGKSIPYLDNTFDVVFTACVFHHIESSEHNVLLKEILRVLIPGGIFVVFEHNPYNPLTRHVVNSCIFDENAELITAKDFKDKLVQTGFENISVKYRIFFPHILKNIRFLEKWLSWLPLGAQYYMVGSKRV